MNLSHVGRLGVLLVIAPLFAADSQAQVQQRKPVAVPPPPTRPNCDCYFSNDCTTGNFCYWGPAGPFVEDHCSWRVDKPGGTPGTNCDEDTDLPGGCDGVCQPTRTGSRLGSEDRAVLALGIDLWAQAFFKPGLSGGGLVDPKFAELAYGLPYRNPTSAEVLGRVVGGLFVLGAGQDTFHPDPELNIPEGHCAPGIRLHHIKDLNKEPWRIEVLQELVALLHAEMAADVDGARAALDAIAACAPNAGQDFLPVCGGDGTLACLERRTRDVAVAILTPRVQRD